MEHWECKFCKGLTTEDKNVCWNCGKARAETDAAVAVKAGATAPAAPAPSSKAEDTEAKYPALRTISTLLSVFAVLVLVLSIVVGIVLFVSLPGATGFAAGAIEVIFGLVLWLFLKASAESLVVLIDIERNTRVVAARAEREPA
jgi:hypothetical protein